MQQLIIAALAFVGSHFVLSHPLRASLVGKLGAKGFQGVYSLVALGTFVWMAYAYLKAGTGTVLWDGMDDPQWIVASVIMLLASVLLVGSFQGNPALPAPGAEALAAKGPHGVFWVTRHPMMWSMALWAVAHALINSTPRGLVLTGAVALLALVGSRLQDRKKEAAMGAAWREWEAKTSFWPRLGALGKAGAVPWIGGVVLWLAATWAHGWLDLPPAGIWRWL